ncbi:MAG: YdcF family protein [Acidimicrobiales bacterium]
MTISRILRRGLAPTAAALVGSLLLYAEWMRRPPTADDPKGDAVVVHAGPDQRLGHALELMERGAAPTLVIMYGRYRSDIDGVCGQTDPYEVLCPTPDLRTTIGEARTLRRLVQDRGWQTVITVTSDYHLRRATYLDAKYGKVKAIGSGAGQDLSRREAFRRTLREMAAMIQARLS